MGRTCTLISRSPSSISLGDPSNVLILACKAAYLLSPAWRARRVVPLHYKHDATTPSPARTSNRGSSVVLAQDPRPVGLITRRSPGSNPAPATSPRPRYR